MMSVCHAGRYHEAATTAMPRDRDASMFISLTLSALVQQGRYGGSGRVRARTHACEPTRA